MTDLSRPHQSPRDSHFSHEEARITAGIPWPPPNNYIYTIYHIYNISYIPYIPYISYIPYIPSVPYIPYVPYVPYIPYLPRSIIQPFGVTGRLFDPHIHVRCGQRRQARVVERCMFRLHRMQWMMNATNQRRRERQLSYVRLLIISYSADVLVSTVIRQLSAVCTVRSMWIRYSETFRL